MPTGHAVVPAAIRNLTLADVTAADRLLRATFGSLQSAAPRVERYLALEPDGWFVAERDGALVGMVGAIRYGAFAYIGFMAVEPAAQGRGIGRRLLEHLLAWLDAGGVRCAILDATPEGALLYERCGFVDAGTSHELVATGPLAAEADDGHRVDLAADRDLAGIVALDRALFGADRARLWRRLFDERASRVLVARAAASGDEAVGYLCVQPSAVLGPWGARTPEAARSLLSAALRRPSAATPSEPLRVQIPGENQVGQALLLEAGFVATRAPRHMRRGDLSAAPGWPHIYGKGSFCVG